MKLLSMHVDDDFLEEESITLKIYCVKCPVLDTYWYLELYRGHHDGIVGLLLDPMGARLEFVR